jgi:segregation and condensation protein B
MSKKAAKRATKTESGGKAKTGILGAAKKPPQDKSKSEPQPSKAVPKGRQVAGEETAAPVEGGTRRVQVTVSAPDGETKARRRTKHNIIAVPTAAGAEETLASSGDVGFANSPFAADPGDATVDSSHASGTKQSKRKRRSSDEESPSHTKKKASQASGKASKKGKRPSKTAGETPVDVPGVSDGAESGIAKETGRRRDASDKGETNHGSGRRNKSGRATKVSSGSKVADNEPAEPRAALDEETSGRLTSPSADGRGRTRPSKKRSSKSGNASTTSERDPEHVRSKDGVAEPETVVEPSVEAALEGELEMATGASTHAETQSSSEDQDEEEDEASILDLSAERAEEADEEELSEEEENQRYLKGIIEALLFASDKPLAARELARAARIDKKRTAQLLAELRKEYRHRGVNIIEVSGGFVLRSNPVYGAFVQKALALRPVKLSRAQLETLAIVAYRQPITRPEIDDIRGVDSGQVLKGLADRDLIKMVGKKDEAGRPMLYGTTDAFLELFTLESLKGLPNLREFTELSEDSREKFTQETGETMPGPSTASESEAAGSDESAAEAAVEDSERDGAGPGGGLPEDDVADGDGASELEEAERFPSPDEVVVAEAVSEDVGTPKEAELDDETFVGQPDAEPGGDSEPHSPPSHDLDALEVDSERSPDTVDGFHGEGVDTSVSDEPDEDWNDDGASEADDELR